MRVTNMIQKTIEEPVLAAIVCNKCGRRFEAPPGKCIEYANDMEFHHYSSTGGYCSKIGDMVSFSFDLCDDCMLELLRSFKVPVEFHKY